MRIISEALDDTLSPGVERMLDQPDWAAKLGAATGAILHRPASVKDMWRLRETALRMSARSASGTRRTRRGSSPSLSDIISLRVKVRKL